jgi:glutamate N-acetyltransferase / amino-acid N-acetyltransferase
MLPKGFLVNGVKAGIKKNGKLDMALFYSESACNAAGMFTSNLAKAAPVIISRKYLIKNPKNIRAVVANAGCANACTGKLGLENAQFECQAVGANLNLKPYSVLVASTGVIGQHLPMEKILKGIETLSVNVLKNKSDEKSASQAIMTTDTFAKTSFRKVNGTTIWGTVKGAGMIHPDLKPLHATMLSFILTDAKIDTKTLNNALKEAVENSFNCVSVDGDTSTNDTVVILANGKAENKISTENFKKALNAVCLDLAKMIAKDGEGATKLIEVLVKNAKSSKDAKIIASTIATSPLCKTAIFGNDANWGRILAAAGRAGVNFNPEKTDIYLGSLLVAKNGAAVDFSESAALKILKKNEVKITMDLKAGKEKSIYYTCDLTFGYIKENASYRS